MPIRLSISPWPTGTVKYASQSSCEQVYLQAVSSLFMPRQVLHPEPQYGQNSHLVVQSSALFFAISAVPLVGFLLYPLAGTPTPSLVLAEPTLTKSIQFITVN
jgi:hypothetical protein